MADAPRPTEIDLRELTSFSEAGRLAEQFEKVLGEYGVVIAKGSDLESVSLELMLMEGYRLGEARPDPMTDIRPMLGRAAGWIDFVKLLFRAHSEGKLGRFIRHIHLLNKAKEVAQNKRVPVSNEADNKLFELFIALCCSPFCDEVILDPPDDAKGDNPDVLARSEGILFGFACKVLNGNSPLTMFERLEEGIDQIEVSPAETGFVFFNFRNILDHARAWPLTNEEAWLREEEEPRYGSWRDHGIVLAQLSEFMNIRWNDCVQYNEVEQLARLFTGKKTMSGAAVYMATSTSITTSVGPMATVIGQLATMRFSEIQPEGEAMLNRINDVLHGRR